MGLVDEFLRIVLRLGMSRQPVADYRELMRGVGRRGAVSESGEA